MNYLPLARKWRPDSFESLVGQAHVVRALANALDQQRLHHAYLFTGTRGVGKTTLGRILAKCLNCARGISSKPCNACPACEEITSGRFIDLIEVDAASRTKVEDTRELLENVPYAPTSGRFKVYLIDEVHMLSTHSFNALLKTLEEPPSHVKFLLATTDPQKLPVTILSRCLQFHLKCLSSEQIAQQLAYILQQEKINYEEAALERLAYAAEGSMRDALSLLDQAIAFGEEQVTTADVKLMLSTIEATYLYEILDALANKDANHLIEITQRLADKSADFANVLEELMSFLHQIAIAQFVPNSTSSGWDREKIMYFTKLFSPQDIQLFYQIGLIGRKDLPFAPTARIGLEMILLRMLAFQPDTLSSDILVVKETHATSSPTPPVKNSPQAIPKTTNEWQEIIQHLNLSGMTAAIANHCVLQEITNDEIILAVDPSQTILLNKKQEERLAEALQAYFKRDIRVSFVTGQSDMETPAQLEHQEKSRLKSAAEQTLQEDPHVKKIIETFNATLLTDTIVPNEE